MSRVQHAVVRILEEPAYSGLRFRYLCESRSMSAGSIPGVNSTPENKTFPTIQVEGLNGYEGPITVIVSCVSVDAPYKPHPHNIVGRECKKGVFHSTFYRDSAQRTDNNMVITFDNLGIQCSKSKKPDIEKSLTVREEINVDPFKTGFDHKHPPVSINMNEVRLCFQVFLDDNNQGRKSVVPLSPVVSQIVRDKKTNPDLAIVKLSHCSVSVDESHLEIILLCKKVKKDDIKVRFSEQRYNKLYWSAYGEITNYHGSMALCFKPPKYHTLEITDPVQVSIELMRSLDGAVSKPLPFQYLPQFAAKRRKMAKNVAMPSSSSNCMDSVQNFLMGFQQNQMPSPGPIVQNDFARCVQDAPCSNNVHYQSNQPNNQYWKNENHPSTSTKTERFPASTPNNVQQYRSTDAFRSSCGVSTVTNDTTAGSTNSANSTFISMQCLSTGHIIQTVPMQNVDEISPTIISKILNSEELADVMSTIENLSGELRNMNVDEVNCLS